MCFWFIIRDSQQPISPERYHWYTKQLLHQKPVTPGPKQLFTPNIFLHQPSLSRNTQSSLIFLKNCKPYFWLARKSLFNLKFANDGTGAKAFNGISIVISSTGNMRRALRPFGSLTISSSTRVAPTKTSLREACFASPSLLPTWRNWPICCPLSVSELQSSSARVQVTPSGAGIGPVAWEMGVCFSSGSGILTMMSKLFLGEQKLSGRIPCGSTMNRRPSVKAWHLRISVQLTKLPCLLVRIYPTLRGCWPEQVFLTPYNMVLPLQVLVQVSTALWILAPIVGIPLPPRTKESKQSSTSAMPFTKRRGKADLSKTNNIPIAFGQNRYFSEMSSSSQGSKVILSVGNAIGSIFSFVRH